MYLRLPIRIDINMLVLPLLMKISVVPNYDHNLLVVANVKQFSFKGIVSFSCFPR